MAKLQIPIDDELMKSLKKYALDNDMSLKNLVISSLEKIIATTPTTSNTSIIEQTSGLHEALTNTTNTCSVKTANEDIRLFLQMASDALNDHETQKVIIYNNPLNIEIDQAPPIASPTTPRIFNEEIPEYYQNTVTRLDVDPLEMLPEEVWKKSLEELKRERGII